MGSGQSYPSVSATHSAPSNIALIKYWGKRDAAKNLPLNSSISLTMSQDDMRAITTVVASPGITADRLWLNGEEVDITGSKRVRSVLREMRALARDRAMDGGGVIPGDVLRTWKVHIVSRNTFPTAAGLASSAAGYAALVHTLADVFNVGQEAAPGPATAAAGAAASTPEPLPPPPPFQLPPGTLSGVARQGSGSACRSLAGGLVEWVAGSAVDGKDSHGVQCAGEGHWPELALLIAVVSGEAKGTGSTDGMVRAGETSELLAHRARACVPPRLAALKAAYAARDFPTLARLTMVDSNQFHATCADTFPPIFYMNDVSRRIVACVHAVNEGGGLGVIAAYTFDAGPNAVVLTTRQHAPLLLAVLLAHFPPSPEDEAKAGGFITGAALGGDTLLAAAKALIPTLPPALAPGKQRLLPLPGAVKHVYATTVGDGPRVLGKEEALADPNTGLPLVVGKAEEGLDKGL